MIAHLLIFGSVQGVGFRKFVRTNAKKLGIVGWVRNLPEGTVEAEVMGEEDRVKELISLCQKGPFLAQVKSVEITALEKDFPHTDFVLHHDIE